MPSTFHQTDLARLETRGRRRMLALASGVDFSSNDYLGLAGSDELREAAHAALRRGVPLGSGGSRLLRGNHPEHEALEDAAARLFGSASALWAGSGYAANSMLLATLPQPGDLVVYDAMIHASAHEGMRLSRAECRAFAHNDPGAAADAIAAWRAGGGRGTPWIAFETLYSMDGDTAPVAAFAALAEQEGATMLLDEAHAVGVCGPGGRGLAADLNGRADTIVLVTCGKGLGCEGALVLGPHVYRDFLVNRGRGFIFSTAPSPLMAATLRASLAIVTDADDRRERLGALVRHAAGVLARLGIQSSGSHIQPVVIGDDARTMEIAGCLQARGFDVRGIRPPTVPEGTARLRVSITLNVDETDIDALGQALKDIL